jgi:hypothetical protein
VPDRLLSEVSARDLLTLFGRVLDELRARQVVRSSNNPIADYAELLVARALGLTLLPRTPVGCDARDSQGYRYEIKARRVAKLGASTQIGVLRDLSECHFDYLVGVLFDADCSVRQACLVPHDAIARIARYRRHVNGWMLHLRPSLWADADVRDLTLQLRVAQDAM